MNKGMTSVHGRGRTVSKLRKSHNARPPRSRQRTGSVCDSDIDVNLRIISYDDTVRKLDHYYGIVKRQLLQNQSITLGLFPLSSQEKEVADIRTTIYCAASIWSLFQAYRRIDDDRGKAYELGQSCVKCMRGILNCWMRQTENVENFKKGQNPKYALHSKFHLKTGKEVVSSDDYGHLQIDVVSLFLLFLVQMITSGLQIIYTMDEVTFVQNLVYYVERAYRTPDFGMWERGSKYNNGTPELHASSIGMAKAALEAINGCNLFGEKGASWSVIFVDIDAHNRNRSIFETLLPRESSSKNVDASLMCTISFPAFATHDQMLYSKTRSQVISSLEGKYGFKRFHRDGYGTVLEDKRRRFYHSAETKEFEKIECQWPLFYLYMILEGMFKNNEEQVEEYKNKLKPLVKRDKWGDPVIPMYYFVHKDNVEDEQAEPGSQYRQSSPEGTPKNLFLWGQSIWIIASLLMDNLLHINELDLIRRHLPSYNRPRKGGRYSAFQRSRYFVKGTASDLVVQVVLIAESMRLQAMMATYGIQTQTPHEVEPVQIWPPKELVKVYQNLGVSEKLGLGGRPTRPIGALGTSKIYRVCGQTVLCYPLVFEVSDFYLSHDMALLIDDIKTELHFVGKYWRLSGRPTVCILIREEHMRDVHFRELLDLLAMLKSGYCDGLKIRTGRLQNLIASSCIEHLDFMNAMDIDLDITPFEQLQHASIGYQSLTDVPTAITYSEDSMSFKDMGLQPTPEVLSVLRSVSTLHGQTQLLGILLRREGRNFQVDGVSVQDRVCALLRQASSLRYWAGVRECNALLSKEVESISPYITTILVSGKQLTAGYGKDEILLDKPVQPAEIHDLFYTPALQAHNVVQAVLQQEVVLYCGKLIATHTQLFNGILNIRIGWVIKAMTYYLHDVCHGKESIESLAPNEVRRLVVKVLSIDEWAHKERLTPQQIRVIDGCLGRTPKRFYEKVFHILSKSTEGVRLCDQLLPQHPTISEMSSGELNFALTVQSLLNRIQHPEYRQIVVELFSVIATILERNPELKFLHELNLDQIVKEAFKMFLKDLGREYTEDMSSFYNASQVAVTSYLARAIVNFMLTGDVRSEIEEGLTFCKVS
ncbi:probable phosphorylase b kinase regulatory subunit beta isoform X3 [Homarus americanus]|uniref:probable phosphorylase b kinase regulatory subunit beta isoform X3 n=1 Tax=Homarus americanus TaxID=6706 RepID=UPI001C47D9BB|nr:probable phosphorylase b kinase regulatory subunit beta isoform X3 [Homarus americanus]